MRHDHLLELERIGRLTGAHVEIGFIDRQRIVGERNAGDVDVEQRQFFDRQCRELDIVRAGAGRAGQNENFRDWHQRLRFRGR